MKWKEYRKQRDQLNEAGFKNMWDDIPDAIPVEEPPAQAGQQRATPPPLPGQAQGPEMGIGQAIQRGRQMKQQDQKFEQRQNLFAYLKNILPEVARADFSTPEAASQLYNQLGRSMGIIEKLKQNPQFVQKAIEYWFQMASEGDVPCNMFRCR